MAHRNITVHRSNRSQCSGMGFRLQYRLYVDVEMNDAAHGTAVKTKRCEGRKGGGLKGGERFAVSR